MKKEWYVIMLKNYMNDTYNYLVFEKNVNLESLIKVISLSQEPQRLPRTYQCTLCDPTPDFRVYQIVDQYRYVGTEKGAIYKLIEN